MLPDKGDSTDNIVNFVYFVIISNVALFKPPPQSELETG